MKRFSPQLGIAKMNLLTELLLLTTVLNVAYGVAFSANQPYRTRDVLSSTGPYFLAFNHIMSDSNEAFNGEYGAYRAPVSGYYALHLCLTGSRRRRPTVVIGLYTYSVHKGRNRLMTFRNNNGKCYSLVTYLNKNEYVYNVVERGQVAENAEEVIFSGYLVDESENQASGFRPGARTLNSRRKFPASSALPEAKPEGLDSADKAKDSDDIDDIFEPPPFLA